VEYLKVIVFEIIDIESDRLIAFLCLFMLTQNALAFTKSFMKNSCMKRQRNYFTWGNERL